MPVSETLFGNEVFVNVVQLSKMWSYWVRVIFLLCKLQYLLFHFLYYLFETLIFLESESEFIVMSNSLLTHGLQLADYPHIKYQDMDQLYYNEVSN